MRRPEAVELFIEMSGKNIVWWEPVYESKSMFLVRCSEGKEWFVLGDRGDIITWEKLNDGSN